jgi:hypothetical protein
MNNVKCINLLITSGASPTIHLQSGLKASGPLQRRSNMAEPK